MVVAVPATEYHSPNVDGSVVDEPDVIGTTAAVVWDRASNA
jgi:hypothetical protein